MAIPTPVLTITNNNDGTATYTVSGGHASATNVIKYCLTTSLTWTTIATITGNSSQTVSTQTGTHWFACFSTYLTDSVVSEPQMNIVTAASSAVFKRILDAVLAELQSLATAGSLPGIPSASIARQDMVFISNAPFDLPGILIAPGAQEEDKGGTNARDDLSYPVMVVIVDSKWAKDPDPASTDIDYLLIRERIRRHFQHRRLALVSATVPESYTTNVGYEGILDHQTDSKGLMRFGSYLQLNFCTREPRGA